MLLKCLPVTSPELHIYGTEHSWRTSTRLLWDGSRAAPSLDQLVLVAAAIRLQLSEGKQGMEMPCVDIRSLALAFPSVFPCSSCFALLAVTVVVREAASPTQAP